MRRLLIHLTFRLLWPTLLALLAASSLIWLLQALRLGHHLVGAPQSLSLIGQLVVLSAPTLLVFAGPLALAIGLLFLGSRLVERGELVGLRALGVTPLQLALPGLVVAGMLVPLTLLAARAEEHALHALETRAIDAATRAFATRPPTGEFLELGEATLHLGRRGQAEQRESVLRVLLADRDAHWVVVAAEARLSRRAERLLLVLQRGELQARTPHGLRRMRFERFEQDVELAALFGRHFGWLGRITGQTPPTIVLRYLAVALLVSTLGFALDARRRRMLGAGLAISALESVVWLAQDQATLIAVGMLVGLMGVWAARRARQLRPRANGQTSP